jgi:hypothetical protein
MSTKGSGCSVNGRNYEFKIHEVVKHCKLNGTDFNTQTEENLGGCGSKNDIECTLVSKGDVPIEIKKSKTPDWMQCSLKYDTINKKWMGSDRNKIPEESKKIFEESISKVELFGGNIPIFMQRDITYEEWIESKKQTNHFKDIYINCLDDTIKKLYSAKGCKYIQVSDKGLYHLGDDVCNFNVPEFLCEQQFRIRIKVHSRKDKKGFCKLSVTIACQPKNIKEIKNSDFTLDDPSKLPLNLIYSISK